MPLKQIFKAIDDIKEVLYENGNTAYNQGVDDTLEAVLRHLGLLNQYNNYKKRS